MLSIKRCMGHCFTKYTLLLALFVAPLVACSDSKTAGGTSEETQIIAIEDKTIAGVSQKGPFLKGSSITIQELDGSVLIESGKLYQTGKSFKKKIFSDKGEFSVTDVSLKSQFALMETEGFYRNEVTGDVSKSQITLNALVDLSDRETANINLLTHLEYERVVELVGGGKTVSAAKKKAEAEVFNAFGIEVENASAEDLDIFAQGDDNAALLAISILMQGDLTEGKLSDRLASFASDIEKDGTWEGETTKAEIADWASTANLSTICSNIRSWALGEDVPSFEKYVKRFWWNNYGLGTCNDSEKGTTRPNKNELSAYYQWRYTCDGIDWVSDISSSSTGDEGSSSSSSEPLILSSVSKTSPLAAGSHVEAVVMADGEMGGGYYLSLKGNISTNSDEFDTEGYTGVGRVYYKIDSLKFDAGDKDGNRVPLSVPLKSGASFGKERISLLDVIGDIPLDQDAACGDNFTFFVTVFMSGDEPNTKRFAYTARLQTNFSVPCRIVESSTSAAGS